MGGGWLEFRTISQCVAQRVRRYGSDGPIETLMHVAVLCWASSSPNGAYLGVNALLWPIHDPRAPAADCSMRRPLRAEWGSEAAHVRAWTLGSNGHRAVACAVG